MAKKKATKKAAKSKKATKKKALKKTTMKMAAKKSTKTATKKTAPKKTTKSATKKMTTKAAKPQAKSTPKLAMPVSSGVKAALGQPLPRFEADATGGKHLTLEGLKGKQIVLYFYPKDATPGCTLEGHEFTRLHEEFKQLGVEVYGISRDSIDSHEKFKSKECYTIDLLSDPKGELCDMFDVIKMKNMYGREVLGIERSTFVIDAEGKLVKEWRGVKAEGHAQQVLDFVKNPAT